MNNYIKPQFFQMRSLEFAILMLGISASIPLCCGVTLDPISTSSQEDLMAAAEESIYDFHGFEEAEIPNTNPRPNCLDQGDDCIHVTDFLDQIFLTFPLLKSIIASNKAPFPKDFYFIDDKLVLFSSIEGALPFNEALHFCRERQADLFEIITLDDAELLERIFDTIEPKEIWINLGNSPKHLTTQAFGYPSKRDPLIDFGNITLHIPDLRLNKCIFFKLEPPGYKILACSHKKPFICTIPITLDIVFSKIFSPLGNTFFALATKFIDQLRDSNLAECLCPYLIPEMNTKLKQPFVPINKVNPAIKKTPTANVPDRFFDITLVDGILALVATFSIFMACVNFWKCKKCDCLAKLLAHSNKPEQAQDPVNLELEEYLVQKPTAPTLDNLNTISTAPILASKRTVQFANPPKSGHRQGTNQDLDNLSNSSSTTSPIPSPKFPIFKKNQTNNRYQARSK
jgi:hypothetical protein